MGPLPDRAGGHGRRTSAGERRRAARGMAGLRSPAAAAMAGRAVLESLSGRASDPEGLDPVGRLYGDSGCAAGKRAVAPHAHGGEFFLSLTDAELFGQGGVLRLSLLLWLLLLGALAALR